MIKSPLAPWSLAWFPNYGDESFYQGVFDRAMTEMVEREIRKSSFPTSGRIRMFEILERFSFVQKSGFSFASHSVPECLVRRRGVVAITKSIHYGWAARCMRRQKKKKAISNRKRMDMAIVCVE